MRTGRSGEERVVTTFRAALGSGGAFLERARRLVRRMRELGAVHVGFDPTKLTFALDPASVASLCEAIATIVAEARGDERWAIGMAEGPLETLEEAGSPLMSSGLIHWGEAAVAASALAEVARPGEILCADSVGALRSGELLASSFRVATVGSLRVRAARVVPRQTPKSAVEALRAAGDGSDLSERLRGLARLGRDELGDAVRALRRTRTELDPAEHRRRCQISLALGVALSLAGRPEEALVEAMDALARARESGDERGVKACLAFLTKLCASVSREADAARLRARP